MVKSAVGDRVALMTWFSYHNYGTALQVAALSKAIERLGLRVDVIDYMPRGQREDGLPRGSALVETARVLAYKAQRHLPSAMPYVPAERERRFERFLSDHISLTSQCPTMAELEGLNDRYSIFVCGSDQIWSPPNFDPHYFLDFAGDDRLKVAYAPSVGLTRVDDPDLVRHMAVLCGRLDALSTREEAGSRIVSGITGREVATVVDPTLLVQRGEWECLAAGASIAHEEPYLLVYMLGHNEGQWRRVYALARRLKLAVRVIPVFRRDLNRKGCIKEPVGPAEFVSLIGHASYVCTDSFHCMAFAANLEREFCAFERFKSRSRVNQNSRVHNLLDKLGLGGRLASKNGDARLIEAIDWEKASLRLAMERVSSLSWLEAALELEPRKSFGGEKNHIAHDRTLCCGCSACKTVCPVDAIDVSMDAEGFWRAWVNEGACVSCGMCRGVCPFIEHTAKPISDGSLFSFKSADAAQLLESSSGGAAAAISRIAHDYGATVLGCAFDAMRGGAVGRLVEPVDEGGLASLAGSKYMQSEVGSSLAEAARHDGPVFVTGTPCQIAAARNLMGDREDVLYVDLICHGVPTGYLYKRYREWLAKEYGINPCHVETVFRYKPKGWREIYMYSTDGERVACLHQRIDPYFLMFEAGQCYARCCYECPWRASSVADVRLGDYWGPRFKGDKTGVSMVLVLTKRGRELVSGLSAAGVVADAPISDYFAYQQTENLPEPTYRDRVLASLASAAPGIKAVCDEFAEPVARRRDLNVCLGPVRRLAKGFLGRGGSGTRP